MAALVRKYRVGRNRLAQGLCRGFTLTDSGELHAGGDSTRHLLYLGSLDGVERDFEWGRLAFEAELGSDMALGVRVFASNETKFVRKGELTSIDDFLLDDTVEEEAKAVFFAAAGCREAAGVTDLLLNGLSGRYLWISVEVLGAGEAVLKNFRVYSHERRVFPALSVDFQRHVRRFSGENRRAGSLSRSGYGSGLTASGVCTLAWAGA